MVRFGRGAAKQSRRQTRYLFYLVAIDVLKDVLSRAGMPVTNHDLSVALIKLNQTGNEMAKELLLETACEVIDSYLTPDTDDSVFQEAAFKNTEHIQSRPERVPEMGTIGKVSRQDSMSSGSVFLYQEVDGPKRKERAFTS